MERYRDPSDPRHYRVVRYYTDFRIGLVTEEIDSDLTLEEAEELAVKVDAHIPGEDIVIQDENERGLDSFMLWENDRL